MTLDINLGGGPFDNASSCFAYPPETQVACSAQFLNLTQPPSKYDFHEYPFLWEPIACMLANVTLSKRVDVPDNFNFCGVPLRGIDAFLFAALALVCAGCLFGKLSAVWVLIAGGAVGAVNNYANLREVSSAIAIWLGISPPDLFFYAFLPPLLVDSAIRIDYFMFSKLSVHIVLMAFVMVVLSAVVLTPLILFVLGFSGQGFTWVHGALVASMIASTDALAATAILKQGGGPEKLVVLMEGEALLNDASAITLFEVFMHLLEGGGAMPTVWSAIPTIIEETLKLASIGAAVGLAMSIATGYLLRWLRWRGARPPVEITIILAVAYLSFYVGQSPAKGSGVISVVVFGLWGNYTSKWGMLASTQESGAFDAFWDTLSFASNGLVFFWAGVASMNYFLRSIDILGGNAMSYVAIPCIYAFMMLIRTGCLSLFNITFFAWVRERLSWAEVAFTGWAGLRGAISLIMVADFIAHSSFLQGDRNNPDDPNREMDRVNSDIAIWTAAFVLLTLLINAPSISHVMHMLRLDRIPPEKQAMRAKAKRALMRFTGAALDTLRDDEEEFLQGANWEAVSQYVDISGALTKFDPPVLPVPLSGAAATAVPDGGQAPEAKEGFKVTASDEAADVGSLPAKSVGQTVQQVLLSPFMVAAGLINGTNGAGASKADAAGEDSAEATAAEEGMARGQGSGKQALERSASSRSRSQHGGGGGGGLLGGLMRSASLHQLALLGGGDKSRHSGRRGGWGRSRGGRSGPSAHSGYASDASGTSSGYDESDTSSAAGSGYSSDFGSDLSAGVMMGELMEECPFIEAGRGRERQPSSGSDAPSEAQEYPQPSPPPAQRRGAQQARQLAGQPDIETGLLANGSEGHTPGSGVALPAPAGAPASQSAAGGSAALPPTAAAAHDSAACPPRVGPALPQPDAAGEGDECVEDLEFVRRVQARQRQASLQARPTLGALFTAPPEPAPPAAADPAPPSPRVRRRGSSHALETITENRLQAGEEQQGAGWHQQLVSATSAAPASEADGAEELYYSSVPAAMGRQLSEQLRRQLRGSAGASSEHADNLHALATAAAAAATASSPQAAGSAAAGGASPHARASSADELYYSSVPAAVGRRLQQQLQQQLAATPQQAQQAQQDSGAAAANGSPAVPEPTVGMASMASPAGAEPALAGVEEPGAYYSSVPAALGRQLGRQLQAELAAAGAGQNADPSAGSASPPVQPSSPTDGSSSSAVDYYSTMPAALGQRLAAQMQAELASAASQEQLAAPAQPAPPAADDVEAEAAPGAGYYSSLPASAGRALQRQLQQELAASVVASRERQAQQAQRQAQQVHETAHEEEQPSPTSAPDHYTTMPAAMGRSLQQQLSRELGRQAGVSQSGSPAAGAGVAPADRAFRRPPRPGALPTPSSSDSTSRQAAAAAGLHPVPLRPAQRTPREAQPAAQRRAWEDYHATVTGAAGPSLAAELQRQLSQRRQQQASASPATPAASLAALPQRDLLGRKIGVSSAGAVRSAAERPGLLPLSARGPALSKVPSMSSDSSGPLPATAAAMSVLPAATPLAAQLQLRRVRTLQSRKYSSSGGGSLDAATGAAAAAAAAAAASSGTATPRSEALLRLRRGSPSLPTHRDTSWQHRPLKPARSMGPAARLHRTSASLPSPANAQLEPASEAADILSRTYSSCMVGAMGEAGVAPGAAVAAAGHRRQLKALQRISAHGSLVGSQEPSMHGGAAFAFTDAGASPLLSGLSSPGGGGLGGVTAAALGEMRSRMIAGLKRYFHAKRMEGLLSSQGLRILEYACDHSAEHTAQPLRLWQLLEREVKGNLAMRAMARSLVLLARSWRGAPSWLQAVTAWPVKQATGFLRRMLGRRMLVSCEVAVEYYLSMIHSPQIQWMQHTDEAWPLQAEVDAEVDAAYRFIIDREIEAPDRFGAIQSYRAAMAVLRQQMTFVEELFESGMVDDGERDDMLAPLDKRMRHLEITGPVWKPPRPRAVLRGLPFMQSIPEETFKAVLRAGTIREYRTGDMFWQASDEVARSGGAAGPGAFVVLSGVIRRRHARADGTKKEYFQGIGGVVGSLLALTGTRLPGGDMAVAEGNSLGKGAHLFHLPQAAVQWLQQQAAAGDPAAQQLRLQLLRLAAAYVLESCETDVMEAVQLHLVNLAVAKTDRVPRASRRASQHHHGADGDAFGAMPAHASEHTDVDGESDEDSGEEHRPAGRLAPHRSTSSRRLQRSHSAAAAAAAGAVDHGDDGGEPSAGQARLAATKQQLQQQPMAAAPGGLRHSKSFGGHLAELMQQIALEEFEELVETHQLERVEEGAYEADPTSPRTSEATYPAGGSTADLAAAAAAGAGLAQGGSGAVDTGANGVGPRLAHRSGSGQPGAEQSWRAARTLRHRIKSAARRAPHYAAEVAVDLRRSLTGAVLLELPAGLPFRQTTHAVLLRGQLQSAEPAVSAALLLGLSPPSSPRTARAAPVSAPAPTSRQLARLFAEGEAGAGTAVAGAVPKLQRTSTVSSDGGAGGGGAAGWEATLATAATAAAAPIAPRVIPWLWNPRFRCTTAAGACKLRRRQDWAAGPEGALLMVWPDEDGAVPAEVHDALAAAASARHAAEARQAQAAALRSFPLDVDGSGTQQAAGSGAAAVGGATGGDQRVQAARLGPAAPAAQRPSGLRRLMPWQHRLERRPAASSTSTTGTGAPSSVDGSRNAVETGQPRRQQQE